MQTNDHRYENRGKEGNKTKMSSSVNAIFNSNVSEFVDELCWDVMPDKQETQEKIETKIVSPKIRARIENCEVAILVDSGSEITAISEAFYTELSRKNKLTELPVSNISISVAVGKKSTTIRHQIQLTLQIADNL